MKLWQPPIISVMALLGALIVPVQGYAVAPIIYCSTCPRFQRCT
jgi:hypothetical protein